MHRIPFYKPSIGEAEINEVVDTLRSGWLTTGPKTKTFEKEFAAYTQQSYAVAVNSCTAALHLAFEALGLKRGETVVVPTMTFATSGEVVRYFDAKPLLVDCRSDDFNLDPDHAETQIERAVARGDKVVAIMPVHFGGQIADVNAIKRIALRYNLKIIEDAAHCCPAYYRNGPSEQWKFVGAEADITCYSFYANKTITTGEGGMASTNNQAHAERMHMMSLHGISHDAWKRFTAEGSWYYEIIAPGFKYNLTDIAAAIGIHQLRKADTLHQLRSEKARLYSSLLQEVDELILPITHENRIHSWHLYVIRLVLRKLAIDRAEFIQELKQRGISTSVHWMPLHMHPYYRANYGYKPEDLEVASRLYPEIISLPLYPDMRDEEIHYVCDSIKDIISRHKPATC